MKYETTILNNNGSYYLRVPQAFATHMGIPEAKDYPVTAMIQDELNKKGERFCSFWIKGK